MLRCSEKGELGTVAAEKVNKITAELQTADTTATNGKASKSVETLKTGFIKFKKEKYESVISFIYFSKSISYIILYI